MRFMDTDLTKCSIRLNVSPDKRDEWEDEEEHRPKYVADNQDHDQATKTVS